VQLDVLVRRIFSGHRPGELRSPAGLIGLEPQVFDLLAYLVRNRDRVVSKDDIIAAVWNGRIVSESTLTTRINAVRAAIGDSGETQRLIKTLPRKGLRFVGTVREGEEGDVATPSTLAEAQSVLPLPDRPSIAVLPFANMSGDPEQDYFADGMAEEIITALSRCSWLFVIARNSSFTYKGRAVDVRQVGRELGVRYVLEGSVRSGGNRLRFLGQLVDTTTGAHIWADRFDGELTDVFELQDRFTEGIVAAIEPKLQQAEIERLKNKPAANLNAYDLLLRAQQLEYEFTAESLAAAIRCAEQALVIDPHYAPAMALAANCYGHRAVQGWMSDVEAEMTEGARLATRAVELGQEDGNVLWMAGSCDAAPGEGSRTRKGAGLQLARAQSKLGYCNVDGRFDRSDVREFRESAGAIDARATDEPARSERLADYGDDCAGTLCGRPFPGGGIVRQSSIAA